jgi:hypothetical protein
VDGKTVTYDGNVHGASGSALGVNGEALEGLDLGESFENVPGGTANWVFTDVTGNYLDDSGSVQIVIDKATATISVDGKTVTYDGNAHGATGSALGVNGEALAGLDLGNSFINVPGGTANWVFTDVTGNYLDDSGSVQITIDRRAITVAANNKSKVYGSSDPALTYSVTSGSLAATDEFFGGLERDAGEDIGSYAIRKGSLGIVRSGFVTGASLAGTASPIKASDAVESGLANYTITYQAGLLTVNRRAITYKILNVTKPYLEVIDLSPVTFPTGINGENLTLKRESVGNSLKASVGDYPLTGTLDDGVEPGAGVLDNYEVTLVDGILTATYERARFLVLGADVNSSVGPWVKVIDRKPGVMPTTFRAYEPGFRGGVRVALGDLNGDGIDEIVTAPGRGRAPEIRVFSLQGESLPEYSTLAYVSGMINGIQIAVGDVNGDGREDLVTVPSRGASEVRVFLNGGDTSKPFASPPRKFLAFNSSFIGGAVLAVHDVGATREGVYTATNGAENSDGRAEIIVGSGAGMRATVRTFEYGETAIKQVRETLHFAAKFMGGIASLAVGYANGDDCTNDLFVSAGNGGNSLVEIRDGKNNSLLMSFTAYTGTSVHAPVRIVIRDTNADGVVDEIWTAQGADGRSREIRRFRPTGAQVDAVLEQDVNFRGEYFIA